MRLEDKLDSSAQHLLRYAKAVDIADRFTAISGGLMQQLGPPYNAIGYAIEAAEISLIKAPFIATYLRKTKDYDALAYWLPKEIFALMVPFGDFVDMFNSYRNRTRATLEKEYFEKEKNKK